MTVSEDVMEVIRRQVVERGGDEFVQELILDKSRIGKISEQLARKLETFQNLTSISLNECELVSLEGFPNLPRLMRIELIDNKITGQQLKHLVKLPMLQSLSLGGNLIKSLADLDVLKQLPELYQLDFLNNEVASDPAYRDYLFKALSKLGILDNFNKEGQEVVYDDDEEEDDEDEDEEDDDEEDDDEEDEYEEDGVEEQGIRVKHVSRNVAASSAIEGESDEDDDDEDDDEDDEEEEDDEDDEVEGNGMPARQTGVNDDSEGADDDDGEDDEEEEEEEEDDEDDDEDADEIEANSTQKKKFKPN